MALSIHGRRREDIGRADFGALGGAVGVSARSVERPLDELRDRVELWIAEVVDLPFDEGRLIELRRAIEYRRGQLGGRDI